MKLNILTEKIVMVRSAALTNYEARGRKYDGTCILRKLGDFY